jgi:pimeloyl-ACP methyl ester carboxylesterase
MKPVTSAMLLAASLQAATVDTAKIHWSSAGNEHSKAVIFVHGWTCDESTWQEQIPAISRSYRVITLDLPGHGRSDAPSDESPNVPKFREQLIRSMFSASSTPAEQKHFLSMMLDAPDEWKAVSLCLNEEQDMEHWERIPWTATAD